MCQMSTMIQIHTHYSISRLQHCKKDCHICLCSGMWLYIGIGASKQFFGTVNGKLLYLIHTLTPAIITFARISFCIFIRQWAAHGCHDSFAYPVFGSDQLNVTVLTFLFFDDTGCDFRVYGFYICKFV